LGYLTPLQKIKSVISNICGEENKERKAAERLANFDTEVKTQVRIFFQLVTSVLFFFYPTFIYLPLFILRATPILLHFLSLTALSPHASALAFSPSTHSSPHSPPPQIHRSTSARHHVRRQTLPPVLSI